MTSNNRSTVAYKAVYMIPSPSPFVYIVAVLQQVVGGNWLPMYSAGSGDLRNNVQLLYIYNITTIFLCFYNILILSSAFMSKSC
jgi:hypothetical protein